MLLSLLVFRVISLIRPGSDFMPVLVGAKGVKSELFAAFIRVGLRLQQ